MHISKPSNSSTKYTLFPITPYQSTNQLVQILLIHQYYSTNCMRIIETSFMQSIAPQDWLGIGHSSEKWPTLVSGQKMARSIWHKNLTATEKKKERCLHRQSSLKAILFFARGCFFQNKMIAHGPHVNHHSCANQEGIFTVSILW